MAAAPSAFTRVRAGSTSTWAAGLLLVEPADDFLQAGLHLLGDRAGLPQVLDDGRREKANRRRVGIGAGDRRERDYEQPGASRALWNTVSHCAISLADFDKGSTYPGVAE